MNKIHKITREIRNLLKEEVPVRNNKNAEWEKRILNSSDPAFLSYGLRVPQLDSVALSITNQYEISYEEALQIFKILINTHIHDEKMVTISFISRFKKNFDEMIIDAYYNALKNYCNTWAFCDSSMIKVLGPYLAKKENSALAKKIIKAWASSEHLWIKRASMVIFLKRAMLHKNFNEDFLFKLAEDLRDDPEEYIQKAIGWMLKTCLKYKPDMVFKYLMENRMYFSRSTLRTACEKISAEMKNKILKL
ncbi:MAG: DNA alkylation repair enzyme [Promethearchaeota archaeon]|nr:MAG: DNA alkylation repair enzyme [Candidatus Lokiarchaeota archaeon]